MEDNLITAYSAIHGYSANSDGITNACENATITGNQIVDVTDVGVIQFAIPGVRVDSQITSNTIVSAGIDINAPICADENTANLSNPSNSIDFSGLLFENNLFWTGPNTTFDFGICAGTKEWFPTTEDSTSTGGTFTNNWTGSLSANVRAGIAVDGMKNVTISNDASHPLNINVVNFPIGSPMAAYTGGTVVADTSDGYASGTFPTPVFTGDQDNCLGNQSSQGTNYSLANPNWSTGNLNGWTPSSTSDVYVESVPTSGYNGASYQLVITNTSTTYSDYAIQSVSGFTPGHTFTGSVYAKSSSGLDAPGGFLMVTDSNGTPICSVAIPSGTTSWTQVSCSGTVPSNGILELWVGSNTQPANTWFYFDGASLTAN